MPDNKSISVFLIDDDAFLLDMYALKFKTSGFQVEVASAADEALKKLREGFSPDVILLDIVMPKTDGFKFLELAQKENLLSNSLIIVLSNLGQKEDMEKAAKMGIKNYVVKASFTPSEVVEKVNELLKKWNTKNN